MNITEINTFYVFTTALYASLNISRNNFLYIGILWLICVLYLLILSLGKYFITNGVIFNCAITNYLPFCIKNYSNCLLLIFYLILNSILYFSITIHTYYSTYVCIRYTSIPISCTICDSNLQLSCKLNQTKLTTPKMYFYVLEYFICFYITMPLNKQHRYFLTLLFYRRG